MGISESTQIRKEMIDSVMESNNPVKVLVVAPLGVGGVTNMMINIQMHLDRSKINFDYLVFHDRKEPLEDTVIAMGSRKLVASVDDIPIPFLRRIIRIFAIRKVCSKNHVKIMHYNADTPLDVTNIIGAKLGGVKYITIHSHNSGFLNAVGVSKLIGRIFQLAMLKLCDRYWGCSDRAARALFPKKIIHEKKYAVLPNAIDLEKFDYNPNMRNEMREKLGVSGKFVLGHSGRFSKVKNHQFLIDIFYALHQKEPESRLLLFGVGELMDVIKTKVKNLGLSDTVMFYGTTNEMYNMWQAIDVFCMPSYNEGMPVTGIEAQASGLPCIFSDGISREVGITKNTEFISLKKSPDFWAERILYYQGRKRSSCRDILAEAGYDIHQVADTVEKLYLEVADKIT